MRKSIQVVPGIRLNLSKTGVGASFGAGPARYTVHSSGRRTVSARSGIPGVYYQKSVSGRRRRGASASPARPVERPAPPRKPGLFAPRAEKSLWKAISDRDAHAVRRAGDDDPDYRIAAWSVAGLWLLDDPEEAARLLQSVFDSGRDPAESPFVVKYLTTHIALHIAPGITADLPLGRDAVGLALAELKQRAGDLDGAIETVEQLTPTTYAAVSLADLYAQAARWDDVVDMTEGVKNDDDASALLLCYRGSAFRAKEYYDAANESLKEALRQRSQPAEIRHLALSERAESYLAQGKKAQARKDLERILAEDSNYEGVRERLAELTTAGNRSVKEQSDLP